MKNFRIVKNIDTVSTGTVDVRNALKELLEGKAEEMKQKVVYQTDPDGYYTGETLADESPLEKGVWLIPAGAVETKPPSVESGKIPRWNGRVWEVVLKPSAPEPDQDVDENVITFRQFILRAYDLGWFKSAQEAEDLATRNSIPQLLTNALDQLSDTEKLRARITILTMTVLKRDDELLNQMTEKLGVSKEEVDNFFKHAAKL